MENAPDYRVRIFRTWPGVCLLLAGTIGSWVLYHGWRLILATHNGIYWLCWWSIAVALLCFIAVVLLSSLITITITDAELIVTRPDAKFRVAWSNIKRIESVWAIYGGNFEYHIVTSEGKRLPAIPNYIDRCDELLQIIQQRSGKRIVSETRTIGLTVQEGWQQFVRFFKKSRNLRR